MHLRPGASHAALELDFDSGAGGRIFGARVAGASNHH